MDKELNFWAMIKYTFKKPLSVYNLLSQTELVKRKVPSGIIYTCSNLLYLQGITLTPDYSNIKSTLTQQ